MNPYLGGIFLVGFNFAPLGYAFCQGQLLAINQNTALFSLLGTFYGGNGITTFALPDLRGRVPINQGQGPGLSPYNVGELGGVESVTLNANNLPSHNHTFNVNPGIATTAAPGATACLAGGPVTGSGPNAAIEKIYTTAAANTNLSPATIGATGGGQPAENRQPYLVVSYIIALQGIFPARN